MGKKRVHEPDKIDDTSEGGVQAPVVRSRRERAIKARLRNDGDQPSSNTDSGSGDYFSPTNISEPARSNRGEDMQDSPARRERKRAKVAKPNRSGQTHERSVEPRAKRASGGIFKTAAIRILTEAASLLSSGAIYDRAMKQGLVSESSGKTPEATMAAALYTDIKKYRSRSTFIKPREGLFGLRDWLSEDCSILTAFDRAELANAKESEDSVAEISGASLPLALSEKESTPTKQHSRKVSKAKRKVSRQQRVPTPKTVQKSSPRQTRSHSVPPSVKEEAHGAAQPTQSEPPAIFANERLQALFMAVDQVSGSSATSNPASLTASVTESDEEASVRLPSAATPFKESASVSLEADGESAHLPVSIMVKAEEEAELQASQIGEDRSQLPAEPEMYPCRQENTGTIQPFSQPGKGLTQSGGLFAQPEEGFAQPGLFSQPGVGLAAEQGVQPPFLQANYTPLPGMRCLSPEERLLTMQQIETIERQLLTLDQTDKTDPQVGNCHMQLSSLYLSLGHREKAVQSYVIALEQCEAMLT